jgi:8-oxo-dGTP diphosphatase
VAQIMKVSRRQSCGCKITGGDLATTDEVSAFRWATAAEVTELADEAYAIRVLDALGGDHP